MELEQIWTEYQSSVTALVRSRVSNAADADDIVQEVLVKTFKGLENVESEHSVKAWLFQVTKRTIIDHYRKKGLPHAEESVDEASYSEKSEHVQQALSRCVQPFIQALPDDERAILTAVDIEGRSQKEYAQELSVSYSTLKSRVQRSRAQLRTLFDKCCRFTRDAQGNVADYDPKTGKCDAC